MYRLRETNYHLKVLSRRGSRSSMEDVVAATLGLVLFSSVSYGFFLLDMFTVSGIIVGTIFHILVSWNCRKIWYRTIPTKVEKAMPIEV